MVILSIRLPEALEKQLNHYCETMIISKSSAVQAALKKHLSKRSQSRTTRVADKGNPFSVLVGTGNGRFTTDEVMRLTRGDDWKKP